jgi:hypothetical protein
MNAKRILLAATIAGGLLSASALSASVVIDPTPQADRTEYTAPAPMKIVNPTGILRRYQGETIRLSLTVDAMGQPHNISLLSERDPHLVKHLLPVIAQWKFTPAMKNGRPVTADVVLPIALVDDSS